MAFFQVRFVRMLGLSGSTDDSGSLPKGRVLTNNSFNVGQLRKVVSEELSEKSGVQLRTLRPRAKFLVSGWE